MFVRLRKKLRTLRNALRSQHPTQNPRFPTEPPAPPARDLVTPKLAHRAIKIDYYPTGETSRSIRAAYERAYGGNRRMPGVYSPRDWARLSFALDQTIKGSSVLDVGANRGQFPNLLAESKQFGRIVTADVKLNPYFLQLHPDAIEYREMSVADLGFADNSFDVVTCFEVLEHVEPEAFVAGLRELRRVCKRQLLMSVPYDEPLPLYAGHQRRFVDSDFAELFPNAKLTLLRSSRLQWMFLEENFDTPT